MTAAATGPAVSPPEAAYGVDPTNDITSRVRQVRLTDVGEGLGVTRHGQRLVA